MKRLTYYFKIWLMFAKNALMGWSINRSVLLVFLFGKIIRYVAYFGFLFFLITRGGAILDYDKNQALLFTATFVLIDTVSQFFFRNVYSFRPMIVSGDFDLVLIKPIKPLFRVLLGGPDPIDLVTIPPIVAVVVYFAFQLSPTVMHSIYYIILVLNGLLISAAFHILVLGLGILTTEIDHTIMVYRDVISMGRFPVDIYGKTFGLVLTFVIPVGIMVTFPAKALMGFFGPLHIVGAIAFGAVLFLLSVKFWEYSIKRYTSASS